MRTTVKNPLIKSQKAPLRDPGFHTTVTGPLLGQVGEVKEGAKRGRREEGKGAAEGLGGGGREGGGEASFRAGGPTQEQY